MTTTRELTTTAGEGNSRQPSLHSTVSARHPPEVSIPASTGRRKTRFVRDEGPPDDLVVVVRAAGFDIDGTLADMVRDARYSGESYALEGVGGDRGALFGVSVFAVERDSTVCQGPGEVLGVTALPCGHGWTIAGCRVPGPPDGHRCQPFRHTARQRYPRRRPGAGILVGDCLRP